jgi:anti-sigma regulatory factor (Ser/Thr protein kinase)
MATTLELRLTSGPQAASAARIALHDLAEVLGPGLLSEVRLMVSELVTNSIRHARGGRLGEIALRASVDEERLAVEVADGGPGFEPARGPLSGSAAGGWGLFIVQTLADRWGVGREGTRASVWFEIDLRKRTDRDSENAHRGDDASGGARPRSGRRGTHDERARSGGGGEHSPDDLRFASAWA